MIPTEFDADLRVENPTRGAPRGRPRPARRIDLDGWRVAGIVLLWVYFSPALATGRGEEFEAGCVASLLSSPLLLWLLLPLERSDDLDDDTYRRQAEYMDMLADLILWTSPLSFGVPIAASGRWIEVFLIGSLP